MQTEETKFFILQKIKELRPESTIQLINLIQKEVKMDEKDLFLLIQELEDEKRIKLNDCIFPSSIREYLFTFKAAWYWVIIFVSLLNSILVLSVSANYLPVIRSVLSLSLLLYLPGYVLIKALYPLSVPYKTRSVTLDLIERIALSIGLSLAVIPILGLILYYMPLGLDLAPITLSIFAFTVFLGTAAIYREFQERKSFFLGKLLAVANYEICDNKLLFYGLKGFFRKNLVLIKRIPLDEITNIKKSGNEVSVTYKGSTDIFLIDSKIKSASELVHAIGGPIESTDNN